MEPSETIRAGDRLLFVGEVQSVIDLLRQRGLVPAPDQLSKLDVARPERHLFEVVVGPSCPIVGKTIRDGAFRTRYEGVVLAVARDGARITGKLGDIQLRSGDTLLVEARASFGARVGDRRDFLLVSAVEGSTIPRHDRAGLALAILLGMVLLAAFEVMSMLAAALLASGLMLATRCTTASAARASVDWSVLVVIGAALGIGKALEVSGAAGGIAQAGLGLAGENPWLVLLAVYVITSVFTEIITNNAAAALMFPIVQAAAERLDVSLWPFVVVIMMAASASFATPVGYQTNLMVYGPGGYRFTDFLRIGVPLNLLLGIVTVMLTPIFWPFRP